MWERPTSQRKICGAVENLSKAERDINSDDVVDEWPQNSTVVQSTVWTMFSRIPWRVVANSPKTREPTVTVNGLTEVAHKQNQWTKSGGA